MNRLRVRLRLRSAAAALALATAGPLAPLAAQAPDPEGGAAPDTFRLADLVVTATRLPVHRDALPVAVTVLTGDELRARGIHTVADALREVPGTAVMRAGSHGAQTSLFLRGGQSNYVKVLVDGVAVNDPGGALDFADLTTDQVERIEVVRGPASVLYGSDAVSGVVQVFTLRGRGPARVSAELLGGRGDRVDGGGYGVMDVRATVSGAAGPLDYAAGGARSSSDGAYPFNNGRRLDVATARLGWRDAATELAMSARLSDGVYHFPTDGAGNFVDANAFLDRRLGTVALEGARRLRDGLEARVQIGLATRRQVALDRPDDEADTLGVYASRLAWDLGRRAVDARLDADLPRSRASIGVALEWANAETAYESESQWGPFDAGAAYDRATRGYYVQLLSEPVTGLDLTLGGRIDDSDTFGSFRTHRLGAAYRVAPGTRVRAALGRAFREPTFAESFGSGFGDAGNPALAPERTRSWDAGIEQDIVAGVTLAASWFDQRFDDLIQFTFAPPDPAGANYFNVGVAEARGLELSARARFGGPRAGAAGPGPLVLRGDYTRLHTRVLDPGLASDASFAEGEPLLRRPAHSGSIAGQFLRRGGSIGLTVDFVGEREDLDFGAGTFPAPRITMPGYTTVDLAAEHSLPLPRPALDALLRIENLFGAEYQAIAGFPAPGRVVRVGLRLRTGGG